MPERSRDPIDCVTACEVAARMLVEAGFMLRTQSGSSESRYYFHPARGDLFLLRLSMHQHKKGRTSTGLPGFVAKVTFSPKVTHSEWHTFNCVATGIGRYFMVRDPPAPMHRGARGQPDDGAPIHL
jgi:hypothetical protein